MGSPVYNESFDMGTTTELVLYAMVVAIAISIRRYMDYLDRERIRAQVTSHGGVILDIEYNMFRSLLGPARGARVYDVRYSTKSGRVVSATCATTSFRGVTWLGAAPPGLPDNAAFAAGMANASAEEREYSNSSAPEAITCLKCGASIPASKTTCHHCGWSYR